MSPSRRARCYCTTLTTASRRPPDGNRDHRDTRRGDQRDLHRDHRPARRAHKQSDHLSADMGRLIERNRPQLPALTSGMAQAGNFGDQQRFDVPGSHSTELGRTTQGRNGAARPLTHASLTATIATTWRCSSTSCNALRIRATADVTHFLAAGRTCRLALHLNQPTIFGVGFAASVLLRVT